MTTLFQKTLLCFSMVALLLTAPHCVSVPRSPIKLSSKWDESTYQSLKCVYVKVNADLSRKDEEMYAAIINGFKKSLLKKGVMVKEDFTWDTPITTLDSTPASLQPDVWLILGRPFQDLRRLSMPIPPLSGSFNGQSAALYGNFNQPTYHRQRVTFQMVNPASKKDVWVGEVTFGREDAKLIGTKVVHQWKTAGLLGSTVSDQ
ncbi:MAG: hypothetical protein H7246_14745 [Phycisphaerae bacterium]|nr:hypothetical protein [Saprospiraceae bacterium]